MMGEVLFMPLSVYVIFLRHRIGTVVSFFIPGRKNLGVNADYSFRVCVSVGSVTIQIFYVMEKDIAGDFYKRKKVKTKGRKYVFSIYIKVLYGEVVLTFRDHAESPASYLVEKSRKHVFEVYFDQKGIGITSYTNSCS